MTASALRLALVGFGLLLGGGPALADGLERFEREVVPRLAKGVLTYEKAVAQGPSGFVLENVAVNSMGYGGAKAGGVYRIARVTVEELDFDRIGAGEPAHFAKLQLSGVRIPDNADYAGLLKRAGVLPSSADVRLEYRFDPRTQTLLINRLDLVAPGLARIAAELVLEGVRPPLIEFGRVFKEAMIRSARLTYDDQSALDRAVRAAASRSGKSQEEVRREWTMRLGSIARGKGAQTTAALDAIASLIEDHGRPKGPLRLTMTPPQPMPVGVIAAMMFATDFAKTVGLAAAYPGTRVNAAAEALLR